MMLIDSDDVLLENALEILYKNAKEVHADISIGAIKIINTIGKIISPIENYEKKEFTREKVLQIFLRDSGEFETYSACAKLYSKRIYTKILFEIDRKSNEDRYYFFNAIMLSQKIVVQNQYIYEYKRRKNSLSTSDVDKRILDNIYFAEKIYSAVKEKQSWAEDDAYYNLFITYMWVYRNFYRDIRAIQRYKNELISIRNKIISMNKKIKISKIKMIEVLIIKRFNYLYYVLLKLSDGVRKYEK